MIKHADSARMSLTMNDRILKAAAVKNEKMNNLLCYLPGCCGYYRNFCPYSNSGCGYGQNSSPMYTVAVTIIRIFPPIYPALTLALTQTQPLP